MEEKVGWIEIELGQLCGVVRGASPRPMGDPRYFTGDIPFIKIGDVTKISGKTIFDSEVHVNEEGAKRSRLLKKGSLILSNSGTVCIPKFLGVDACIHDGFVTFNNMPEFVLQNFLFHYFHYIRPYVIRKHKQGVTQVNLNTTIVKEFEFLLPPLPEQRAIVSKIEQLFGELDNGIANLKLAQEQLKVYRQAVLKKAFEGELTKKWREQQTDLPNARDLLEKIWVEKEKEAKVSGKKLNKVKPLTKNELSELPRLPEKWVCVKFGEACNRIFDGTHFSPKNSSQGDFKYITAKNIKEGYLDLSDLSYVTKEDHYEIFSRCDVKKGDILYIKDGATTGKACVNPLEEEFSLLSSVGVFRVNEKYISSKYIECYLNAEVTRHRMLKNVAGVAITRLTLVKLNNSILILPSKEEQQVIVQEIETRLSVCDKIEQDIETNLEKAEALRQSILKKAFEGKLLNEKELAEVRGAEDWEPAEVLLEKIKAEKAENGKKGKQTSEQLKSIIQEDKGIVQQATLRAFEQIEK